MNTDAIHEIEKAFNDLDTHRNLHVLDKFVPRGSQEFREALTEFQSDEDVFPEQRTRSSTIDTTYKKPHLSVHFASNLVTTCEKKNRSGDDLHIHLHPEGILRHSRERSNTYDGTIQRPRRPVAVKSPLCNENNVDSESAVEKLLKNSPNARKVEEDLHEVKDGSDTDSTQSSSDSKPKNLSTPRNHKNESPAPSHVRLSSPKVSPKIVRKSGIQSPDERSRKISAS